MPYVKNNTYRVMPFSRDTPHNDFYSYSDLKDLTAKCFLSEEEIVRCRTIGVLQSICGRFYLSDLDSPCDQSGHRVQVSVVYLKTPPKSTIIPYPVQIFGTLQWKNRPVIYANILQEVNAEMALRMRDTFNAVTSVHSATIHENYPQEEPT